MNIIVSEAKNRCNQFLESNYWLLLFPFRPLRLSLSAINVVSICSSSGFRTIQPLPLSTLYCIVSSFVFLFCLFQPWPLSTSASFNLGIFQPWPLSTLASFNLGLFQPRPISTLASFSPEDSFNPGLVHPGPWLFTGVMFTQRGSDTFQNRTFTVRFQN